MNKPFAGLHQTSLKFFLCELYILPKFRQSKEKLTIMLVNKLLRSIGLSVLLLGLTQSLFAQKTVTGKVSDSKDGGALQEFLLSPKVPAPVQRQRQTEPSL
jgi:hypothetical protein